MVGAKQKFIYVNEYLAGVRGEKTLTKHSFPLPMGYVEVLITEEPRNKGEEYFNVYIVDEHFKVEVMNCLKEQIPKQDIKKPFDFFCEKWAELRAIEHYLWFKYGNPDKDTVLSFSIEEHE